MAARELIEVEIDQIDVEKQVRTHFDEQTIEDLAENIATVGLQQPIVLTRKPDGRYLLLQGERRLRAVTRLQAKTIEAVVTATEMEETERIVKQLTENIMREDMNPFDVASACKRLRDRGLTWEELGKVLGTSKGNAYRYEALFDAPSCVKDLYFVAGIRNITLLSEIAKLHSNPKTRPAVDLFMRDHDMRTVSARELSGLKQSIKNVGKEISEPKRDGKLLNRVLGEMLEERPEEQTLEDIFGPTQALDIFRVDGYGIPVLMMKVNIKQGELMVPTDAMLMTEHMAPTDMEAFVSLRKEGRHTGYALVPLRECQIVGVRIQTPNTLYGPVFGKIVVPVVRPHPVPQAYVQLRTGESAIVSVKYLSRRPNTLVVRILSNESMRIVPIDMIERIIHINFE